MHQPPLIGISTDLLHIDGRRVAQLDLRYAEAVLACGGLPVLLPPLPSAEAVAERLDGLILSGGDGLPASLGAAPGALPDDLAPVSPQRLEAELKLYRRVLRRGRPVLGVCLGMQLMNLEAGGTLWMDVARQRPGAAGHSSKRGAERHALDLPPGSPFDRWRRDAAEPQAPEVNSSHVQAVEELGLGFVVAARAADGVIEAIVPEGGIWPLGVQWHPEREPGVFGRGLIQRFVEACSSTEVCP